MIKQQSVNSKFKLELILKITQAINENLSVDELLQQYQNILFEDLKIGKIAVFKFNSRWEKLLVSGISRDYIDKIKIEKHLSNFSEITYISSDLPDVFQSFDFIIPVFHKNSVLAYILIGDIDEEMEGMSPAIRHLSFIQTISNIIIVAMENKRMYKQLLIQEAFKKEMELASKIQNLLIPNQSSLPQNQYISTRGYYQPHLEIGGDYYDFINFNNQELGFCIGDVSGKGIPAALIMSNFQATLRALFRPETPLDELMRQLNQKVCENSSSEKFLTFFIGIYNYTTRKLKYVNASHHPPLLYNFEKGETTLLKEGCIGLGMLDEIPKITVGEITIEDNSKLLCYTDGLIELERGDHMEVGVHFLTKMFATPKSLSDTFSDLIQHIDIGKKNKAVIDDISLFGIEFNSL
ncbi:serine/threonine-protein phosphatase [Labilibaculum sp. DW002]|uniref:Serine/threonine-protein phosphatase n=1 Tax=Paralabilibaculum antarcticum TaxID=2912572 RepID=A0ABT5VSZ0_9BACT|nr:MULTISPECIES: PP2C family protein-serine/threonine phosphatase [unclassified Labilibaculum]MBI9056916.1 serine/threonine-protein phosphatase [Labilibaculum sp.]MDE5418539.1 serine/threonine-protein phosphatase [Labilibaculum sp. DW002]